MSELFATINISRVPAIYRAVTKSRKTEQSLITMFTTIGAIRIRSTTIPSIFMEIYGYGEITYYAI